MIKRDVHYEAAFEAYLRQRGTPYVGVDEAKKALFSTAKLKSFDFVVYSKSQRNLLVDVKGRSCRESKGRRSFESWTTQEDVSDLAEWERVFGEGFGGLFCFVYWIDPPLAAEAGMFTFRDKWYQFMGIDLTEYRNAMKLRSEKWNTVCLSAADFRMLARPFEDWL